MTPSERFKVHPKIVSETIDGEVIMLNLDRGRYYSLTLAGTVAWNAIGRAASNEEIVDELLARYDGARSEVEQAVHQLLDELRREELILSLPPGAAETAAPSSNGSPRPTARTAAARRFRFPCFRSIPTWRTSSCSIPSTKWTRADGPTGRQTRPILPGEPPDGPGLGRPNGGGVRPGRPQRRGRSRARPRHWRSSGATPQPLAQAIALHYDYLELEPGAAEQFARDHEAWGAAGGGPEPVDQIFARFLLSTDFFLHGGDVARPVRYLRFYDPYLAPCTNPFLSGRAV